MGEFEKARPGWSTVQNWRFGRCTGTGDTETVATPRELTVRKSVPLRGEMPQASPWLSRKGITGAPWENWIACGILSWWERGRGRAQPRGASESGPQCQRHECRHSHGDAATEHKNLSAAAADTKITRPTENLTSTFPIAFPMLGITGGLLRVSYTVPYVPRVKFGVIKLLNPR